MRGDYMDGEETKTFIPEETKSVAFGEEGETQTFDEEKAFPLAPQHIRIDSEQLQRAGRENEIHSVKKTAVSRSEMLVSRKIRGKKKELLKRANPPMEKQKTKMGAICLHFSMLLILTGIVLALLDYLGVIGLPDYFDSIYVVAFGVLLFMTGFIKTKTSDFK